MRRLPFEKVANDSRNKGRAEFGPGEFGKNREKVKK